MWITDCVLDEMNNDETNIQSNVVWLQICVPVTTGAGQRQERNHLGYPSPYGRCSRPIVLDWHPGFGLVGRDKGQNDTDLHLQQQLAFEVFITPRAFAMDLMGYKSSFEGPISRK